MWTISLELSGMGFATAGADPITQFVSIGHYGVGEGEKKGEGDNAIVVGSDPNSLGSLFCLAVGLAPALA